MNIYKVIDKVTGQEIDRYSADSVIEWPNMSLTTTEHILSNPEIVISPTPLKIWPSVYEFLLEFTLTEQAAIRTAAKQSIIIETFLAMLDVAPAVRNDDPNVLAALPMFEQAGLIASGRANEILYG